MRISDWSSDVCSSDLSGGGVMAKGGNSLQAVLNRAKADGDAAPAPAPAIEPVDVYRKAPPSARQGTNLIRGHFPPEARTHLRLITAPERPTHHTPLAEAHHHPTHTPGRHHTTP